MPISVCCEVKNAPWRTLALSVYENVNSFCSECIILHYYKYIAVRFDFLIIS